MNKPIRAVSIFCMFLFLALMLNISYIQFWRAKELNTDPKNARVAAAAFSRERGLILVGDDPVAKSEPVDDRYKYLRVYPQRQMFAPVTGYLQLGSQTGIERSQNEVLSGEDPLLFVNRLADLVRGDANKGGNVLLTLDAAAQRAAFNSLRDTVGPEGEGAVVAIQPKTGRVLAMVSIPTYDPNQLASHDRATREAAYDRLDSDEREPLVNRAIQTRLFPGSTFKIVTAAAALEDGLYDVGDEVPSGATWQAPGTTGSQNLIDNEGRSGCSPAEVSFETAMAQSCNTAFAKMAVDVGPEKLREQAEAFGFNSDYLLDLGPQARSVFPQEVVDVVDGQEQEPRELNDAETARSGFGQFSVQATPLQMAMVAAGIANGGDVMKPYLVQNVKTADLKTVSETKPESLHQAVSPEVASQLTQMMVDVVENGTGKPGRISGVQVAGKTGTAQTSPDKPPFAWFTSFAPANDPKVAVAVMIEDANVPRNDIAGGTLAAPIAKSVMEAVLSQ